jgi:hypothetical protein
MNKPFLTAISSERRASEKKKDLFLKVRSSVRIASEKKNEDFKFNDNCEVTNLEFVNKHRDFSTITENDLDEVFHTLRARCPKS